MCSDPVMQMCTDCCRHVSVAPPAIRVEVEPAEDGQTHRMMWCFTCPKCGSRQRRHQPDGRLSLGIVLFGAELVDPVPVPELVAVRF